MALRITFAGLLLALACGPAAAGDLSWSLPADASPAQVDGALQRLGSELLQSPALTDAQRSHALLATGRYAQAQATIQGVRTALLAANDTAAAQRWVPMLLLATAGDADATAYTRAFHAAFNGLDDVAAVQADAALSVDPATVRAQLAQALAAQADAATLPDAAALELVQLQAVLRAQSRAAALAPALLAAEEQRRFVIDDTLRIPAAEGVVLSAQLARPRAATAPLPAAMLFTIYTDPPKNRLKMLLAAAHGYAGIVVDARGKGQGTGTIAPYEHDGEDANAAIDWVSRQAWNDGRVAMYGGSYEGFTAWAAARHHHPALKTIVPYVAAIPGQGVPMENNVFLSANYGWAFYVTNGPMLDTATYAQRARWSQLGRRWYTSGRSYRQIDQIDGTPNPWLQRWLAHPSYDAYWQAMVPYGEQFADIRIPVLTITGYYDDGQISALQYVREHLRHRPDADHTLLIGPYDHSGAQSALKPMQLRGYALDPVAQFDTPALTFQWLDHVLRGAPRPALVPDRVNYQLMGADRWGHAPSLQAAAGSYRRFHLSAARASADGYHHLQEQAPPPGQLRQTVDLADRNEMRHGYYPFPIVAAKDTADTALSFASEPFSTPMDLVGSFSGDLKVRINKRDLDFTVTLYELMADGRRMQLSYFMGRASHVRDPAKRQLLQPAQWTHLPFDRTRMVARRLAAGSRLLVKVDVLKDAMHQVNHGTGRDVSDETVADAGAPLQVEWHSDSVVTVPLRTAPSP
ncbi:CocE/NonD family hydrolase [Stenotrophomonas sp. 24(2023)]|uniref:CocE/NonD family hydrolase n=1 Tax=Stenotrophomonas sp. 24(2023) TaxID=3068324 RepID=UPI0027E1E657|nr:CocE/NonD family hydrolase [Stenotrophomonas sp. 24(2023)]WMJ69102.1 CocE/NonD family hydrolase [Stenotrophomonas sp. 24(2023)]